MSVLLLFLVQLPGTTNPFTYQVSEVWNMATLFLVEPQEVKFDERYMQKSSSMHFSKVTFIVLIPFELPLEPKRELIF